MNPQSIHSDTSQIPNLTTTPSFAELRDEVAAALDNAVQNLRHQQESDGHWSGDYGGPLFLLPGLVMTYWITGTEWTPYQEHRMLTYLANVQNQDGGWGLHIAGQSTVFGTTLNYVAMRLLGADADHPNATRAQQWLLEHGGASGIPTWGKFWLAVMGLYQWEGINPLSPELWLLPRSLPVHPGNFWCHTRQVFLPMSYIYGRRLQAKTTPLTLQLRNELFVQTWSDIHWPSLREEIAPDDLYTPHSTLLKFANRMLNLYEKRPISWLRNKALREVIQHIHFEDQSTNYLTIGPVSKAIQMLAVWFEDPNSEAFAKHKERVDDYLWDGLDGLKMQGYNGSQLWDTSFAAIAILESRRPQSEGLYLDVLKKAHHFIDNNQVQQNIPNHKRYYRDATKGSWPFSTAEQAWTVSDCTAEGLKACLKMLSLVDSPLSEERLQDAVDLLLASQNKNGGWSEYEQERGPKWLEALNAAEVFGDIMIGYSYTECTSACIQSLRTFQTKFPNSAREQDIEKAIAAGLSFLRKQQREDGSWYGGWGVCFTYGTWFGVDGLIAGGDKNDQTRIQKGCLFLLDKQRDDGSWSESYKACEEKKWIHGEEAQPIQTAWALLPLLAAQQAGCFSNHPRQKELKDAIAQGVRFLLKQQQEDGSWMQNAISGVFNRNCMIHYDNYRHVMPLWALSRFYGSRQSSAT